VSELGRANLFRVPSLTRGGEAARDQTEINTAAAQQSVKHTHSVLEFININVVSLNHDSRTHDFLR
jgi:hypothetical protein